MPAVEVAGLTREFEIEARGRRRLRKRVLALDEVSLSVSHGEILGLLGPNGAGKTTLVKILSTVLLPTSGTARILGKDVVKETAAVRPTIGIVFGGERGLYTRLTARQNLMYWAALYKVDPSVAQTRTEELLQRVGLADRTDSPVETFSRGMRQRLHLARGLIGDPPVLFLDEPTTGMDPVASRDFRELVVELRSEGRAILLTTHNMAEAETVCDRVALIDRGRLLAIEGPRTLSGWIAEFERIDVEHAGPGVVDEVRAMDGVGAVVDLGAGTLRIELSEQGAAGPVLQHLVTAGVVNIRTSLPSLEEVYLRVFGERRMEV